MFDEDEIPVKTLFRSEHDMSELERKALTIASGRVLDMGAETLQQVASACGWQAHVIAEWDHYDYLARITRV